MWRIKPAPPDTGRASRIKLELSDKGGGGNPERRFGDEAINRGCELLMPGSTRRGDELGFGSECVLSVREAWLLVCEDTVGVDDGEYVIKAGDV